MKTPVYSGIITNYNCTAECKHCMFASSPSCKKDYMTKQTADETEKLLAQAGTLSVHIGGGEPFLDFDGLCLVIQALNRYGVGIDYIETNGFWARNEDAARRKIEVLKRLGIYTVMVSVDPFHVEYVPLELPLKLCSLLDEYGMEYFIWQQKFLKRLMALDITKTHTKEELAAALGRDYITDTAKEYGLGINGRALAFAESMYEKRHFAYFATDEKCPSLTHPHHCHLDLYGNAIPSRCTGICAKAADYLEGNIEKNKYPVLSRLISGGTRQLYEYAREKGFSPKSDGYPTRCAFCFDMRLYLYKSCPSDDLDKAGFYENMEKNMPWGRK